MYDFSTVKANLEARGFAVSCFASAEEAMDYLDSKLDGRTIGIGGSVTIRDMGLDQRLEQHNQVIWHWKDGALRDAAGTQVYLTSVNGLAETGEIINIDGTVRDKILSKCPYYKTYTIPADTYPGQTEPVSTITVQATVVVSAQADEDTVYKLTSAIFDHVDDITKENAKGAELKLETATSITTVPYHAGAAKYYAEHGITVNTDE